MKLNHWIPICLLSIPCLSPNLPAQTAPLQLIAGERTTVSREVQATLQRQFTTYDVFRLDVQGLAQALRRGESTHRLRIDQVIDQDVTLEVRDLRSPTYRLWALEGGELRSVDPQYTPNTYVIRDAGQREIGRMNIDEETFEARIRTGEDTHYLRKVSRFSAGADPDLLVVNRLQDVAEGQDEFCDAGDDRDPSDPLQQDLMARMEANVLAQGQAQAGGTGGNAGYETCVQIEIAGAGDYSLFGIHGMYGTQNRVFEVINMAEHIFMDKFGLPFTVTGNVVSLSDDPYNSTDSKTLLKSFRDHWNELEVGIKRDIAILVSGKDFDGGTKGRAYIGVAGKPDKAYGILQSPETDHLDYVLAHEIAHSLDAEHDESGCAHLFSSNRWIMCPWVGSKDFSGASYNAIVNYVNANIDDFISEFTLSTDAGYFDGNFTNGELHAGNQITVQHYVLDQPAYDVKLYARKRIVLLPNTRIVNGARFLGRIIPDLHCSEFGD